MICSKCGGEFGEGNFCSNCGAPKDLPPVNSANPVNSSPASAPAPVVTGGNMKVCKECGRMIAKSAKTCPYCGAKVKPFYKRWWFWLIVAIFLIFFIPAIAGSNGNDDKPKKVGEITSEEVESKTSKKQEKFKVGEIAELNDVTVALMKVTESSGSKYNKPGEGKVFVLCEFEISNNSSKDVNVSSLLNFEAYCDDYSVNTSFSAEMEKENGKNQLDGTVAPGKKLNGVIGYELSDDWKELEVRFTPEWLSGKDIIFVANNG